MDKKAYDKPTLVSQPVALGVFGNYGGGGRGGGKGQDGDILPQPVQIITDQKLRME
jgi:hypothetical protein